MVNVLVDDKQAPTVANLEDITVYCDNVPYLTAGPRQLPDQTIQTCGKGVNINIMLETGQEN
jgi:hypothetical protein